VYRGGHDKLGACISCRKSVDKRSQDATINMNGPARFNENLPHAVPAFLHNRQQPVQCRPWYCSSATNRSECFDHRPGLAELCPVDRLEHWCQLTDTCRQVWTPVQPSPALYSWEHRSFFPDPSTDWKVVQGMGRQFENDFRGHKKDKDLIRRFRDWPA
jgi:hypothetical protein